MKYVLTFLSVAFLSACVTTKSSDLMIQQAIEAPKIIAVHGTRAPWVYEIEKRLKSRGFEIKRMASQGMAFEQVNTNKSLAYKNAAARFILHIDGFAHNDVMRRCFGGGYDFSFINVELIDVLNNETVAHYSNSGFSEGCPPLSGTIFGDIENLITEAWGE